MATVRAHLYVTGYVQGVFFRHSMARLARSSGVTGWVRNLEDGRVEAVIEGEDEAVGRLVEWSQSGPPHATVERVELEWEAVSQDFSGFQTL
jgi:acylphosphatase